MEFDDNIILKVRDNVNKKIMELDERWNDFGPFYLGEIRLDVSKNLISLEQVKLLLIALQEEVNIFIIKPIKNKDQKG